MKRYEVIISRLEYQRLLSAAENPQEAEAQALSDYAKGDLGEILFDHHPDLTVEQVREVKGVVHLPKVQIPGKWYYRDDRMRQYRNVRNPHDYFYFEEVPF